jgi:hypothetical protein
MHNAKQSAKNAQYAPNFVHYEALEMIQEGDFDEEEEQEEQGSSHFIFNEKGGSKMGKKSINQLTLLLNL